MCIWCHQTTVWLSGFLCRLTSWKGELHVGLMGRVSVTISYSFHWLTTETVKYINENSFIENLAASKCSMWAQRGIFFIINNKCTFCMFRRSELACVQKFKQVCVSKCMCTVFIYYVYINTYTQYIFRKYLYAFACIYAYSYNLHYIQIYIYIYIYIYI